MPYENAEYVRTLLEIEIEVLETSRRQSPSVPDDSGNTNDPPSFKWTATVRDLVELIYALYHYHCLNNGKVSLRDLAVFFEQTFQVKIDSIYHTFSKAKLRKKDRAPFIRNLYEKLIEVMDEMDG